MGNERPKKGIYCHFKGKRYELIDIAKHSETLEDMVVYRALYGEGGLWVRPLSMWSEKVERDGRVYTRFVPEEEYLAEQAALDEYIPPNDDAPPPEDDYFPPVFEDALPDPIEPEQPAPVEGDKLRVLKTVFGYDSFRKGQADIIDGIMAGRDTLAVLPTGGGKSVCYQIPALMLDGITIVISPLISLMKDQVEALRQNGVPCAYLNSSLSEGQMEKALDRLRDGAYKIVYVAPERLKTPRFLRIMREMKVSLVAVDEAHCISQWGQDFRPSYLEIPEFIAELGHRPRVCAYTATATQRVRDDIIRLLGLKRARVVVTGFARDNLYFSVIRAAKKDAELLRFIERYRDASGIVYCGTRGKVEEVCALLLENGYAATRYHAGLSDEERQRNQEDFITDRCPLIVATNAFGMGIDKPDVRFVVHYNMPGDIESYYQEAGRAGRDGERAECCLLFEPRDVVLRRFFIEKIGEEGDLTPEARTQAQESARQRLESMIAYARSSDCFLATILRYFGEEGVEDCGHCANCVHPRDKKDVSDAAKRVIACVSAAPRAFGTRTFIDALRGSRAEKVLRFGLDKNPQYGALNGSSVENLQYVIDELCRIDALALTKTGDFPLLHLSRCAQDVLNGAIRVEAFQFEKQPARSNKKAPKQATRGSQLTPAEDNDLFEALRELRMKLAREKRLQPYMIASDRTLRDMCALKPTTNEEMLRVNGMGEYKTNLYGRFFEEEIRKYV